MNFGELLFWIFIAFVAYLFLKFSAAILIIAIIILVVYYLINTGNRERFRSVQQYPMAYAPENLIYKNATNVTSVYPQLGHNTGHSDYFYIPIQDYYNKQINGYGSDTTTIVPPSTSEYCVNKYLVQTGGNLDEAIRRCQVPGSISEAAYSGKN